MRNLVCILLCSLTALPLLGGNGEKDRDEPKYPVSAIDPELKENAYAVVRKSDVTFTVVDQGKSIRRRHVVYTILKEEAKSLSYIYAYYNDDTRVKEFEAYVYDAQGEEIDKLRKSDIRDESAVSGGTMYADTRIQYGDMSQPDYPYTVEFITETESEVYYSIPDFYPQSGSHLSVEQSSFSVRFPEALTPRYREVNFDGGMNEFLQEGMIIWKWDFKNMPAIETEPLSRGIREMVPYVELAPTKFEHSGNPGDMSTWESFGAWFWELNKGRDELPADVVAEVQKLTTGLSERDKVKAIYEYMQNRTRYVSIQLGIGGLQPFEASVVNNLGYGDCKALSNYTYALLKEIGVKSYYTLVEAGQDPTPVSADFPNDPFNHVILCVPMEKDTVWLECTSQINPFNYLGNFTSDRDVLLITEEGGKLVRTPKYGLKDNQQIRTATIRMDEEGNGLADMVTRYQGMQYDMSGLEFTVHEGKEDQKKWIHSSTRISNYNLREFNMINIKDEIPSAVVEMKLDLPRYASRTGKRFYFAPNLVNSSGRKLRSLDDRKTNVVSSYDLVYIDTLEYEFPSSYQVEFLPEPMTIESEFGRYEASTEFVQGKLRYYRRMEIFSGEYPPDKYDDLLEFLKDVESKDKTKVVFTTKT